jgi:hypothetical protein
LDAIRIFQCAMIRNPLFGDLRTGAAELSGKSLNFGSPLATADAAVIENGRVSPTNGDDLVVGLAFSGGGTRAAAFSYGVLSELDRTEAGPRSHGGWPGRQEWAVARPY